MFKKTVYKLDLPGWKWPAKGTYYSFGWTFCNGPKDGVLSWNGGFLGCRDGGVNKMRESINKGNTPTDMGRFLFKFDLNSSRLDADSATAQQHMERAVHLLNVLETMAGWRLTRAYKLTADRNFMQPYYFLSSRRWIKCSYLVYLYVMLVRMCSDKFWDDFKNFAELKEKVLSNIKEKGSAGFSKDGYYIVNTFAYWEALLRGYPELFEKKKIEYYWSPDRVEGGGPYGEGIQQLCSGHTKYEGLYKQLISLKSKFDKEEK